MLPHRRLQATLRALTHSTVQRDDHEPCVQGFAPSSLDWLVSPPRQRSQIIYPHYFVKKNSSGNTSQCLLLSSRLRSRSQLASRSANVFPAFH